MAFKKERRKSVVKSIWKPEWEVNFDYSYYSGYNKTEFKQVLKDGIEPAERLTADGFIAEMMDAQISYINKRIHELNISTAYYDTLLSDIRHVIENSKFTAAQGYKLSAIERNIMKERRKVKLDAIAYSEIKNAMLKNDFSLTELHVYAQKIIDVHDKIFECDNVNKVYKFRTIDPAKDRGLDKIIEDLQAKTR